jgi:L-threonylcarbamoyladenylate synthase
MEIGKDILRCKELLEEGKVVGVPTETVYGLAGNGYSIRSLTAIFEVKERPRTSPLILHTHSLEQLRSFTTSLPPKALQLAKAFCPGPLTLLLRKVQQVSDLATAGSPLVGLRIPRHPMLQALLEQLDFPLAIPSANPFGYISPTTAAHVAAQLGDRIPYILDGGACEKGLESTIVGFEDDIPIIYRLGSIPEEQIVAIVGPVLHASSPGLRSVLHSGGGKGSHYAPTTPIMATSKVAEMLKSRKGKRVGVLTFTQRMVDVPDEWQFVLADDGKLTTAAHNFFAGLHVLDSLGLDLIVAELLPERGLGKTMNERLRRAERKKAC